MQFPVILVYNKYLFLKRSKKIKIISGYREPISRNISMFFQVLFYEYDQVIDKRNFKFKKTKQVFESQFPHKISINWFEKELKSITNINIHNYNFDKEKGYIIINNGEYELFLYKLDSLDSLEREIGQFLEIEDYRLLKSNLSSKKTYSKDYKTFKRKYTPKSENIETLYNSKTMKYFYTVKEINSFKNNWLN